MLLKRFLCVGYRWLSLGIRPLLFMRSEIAANLNVLEFVKIFGEICKTLVVRWSNRYGVTAPSERACTVGLALGVMQTTLVYKNG